MREQLSRRLCLVLHTAGVQDEHSWRRARLQVDIGTLSTPVNQCSLIAYKSPG